MQRVKWYWLDKWTPSTNEEFPIDVWNTTLRSNFRSFSQSAMIKFMNTCIIFSIARSKWWIWYIFYVHATIFFSQLGLAVPQHQDWEVIINGKVSKLLVNCNHGQFWQQWYSFEEIAYVHAKLIQSCYRTAPAYRMKQIGWSSWNK